MKTVLGVTIFFIICAQGAGAEVMIFKSDSAHLQAFKNLDSKLAVLENYSVAYVEPDRSRRILRAAPHFRRRAAHEGMLVRLVPVKSRHRRLAKRFRLKRARQEAAVIINARRPVKGIAGGHQFWVRRGRVRLL